MTYNPSPVVSADTLADMRQLTQAQWAPSGQPAIVVYLAGYDTIGDGGSGMFFWSADDTRTDDGISVIEPISSGGGPGRANRIIENNTISAAACGLIADGSTPNDSQFSNILVLSQTLGGLKLICGAGTYVLNCRQRQ